MSDKIIKIEDLKLMCVPPTFKKKDITRIELSNHERAHFNNSAKQIQFRHMNIHNFIPGNKIRYFEHETNPESKFYMQVKTISEFEKLTDSKKSEFFTLSNSKGDAACTGTGIWKKMFNKGQTSSFDSEKITKVLSDDGWLFEIDLTNFIKSLTANN